MSKRERKAGISFMSGLSRVDLGIEHMGHAIDDVAPGREFFFEALLARESESVDFRGAIV